jgi:hypothetical protein
MEKLTDRTFIELKQEKACTLNQNFRKKSFNTFNSDYVFFNKKLPVSEKYDALFPAKFTNHVVKFLNWIRSNPSQYISKLKILRDKLSNTRPAKLILNGQEILLNEGKSLFDELISQLRVTKSLSPITNLTSLSKAAEDFLVQLQMNDKVENLQLPGLLSRVRKYGTPAGFLAECIDYSTEDAECLLLKLLLNDGDPNRTDRYILLSPSSKFAGICSLVTPSSSVVVTVLEFCEHFFYFDEKIPEYLFNSSNKLKIIAKKDDSQSNYKSKIESHRSNKHNRTHSNITLSALYGSKTPMVSPQLSNIKNRYDSNNHTFAGKFPSSMIQLNKSQENFFKYNSQNTFNNEIIKLTPLKTPVSCQCAAETGTNSFHEKSIIKDYQDLDEDDQIDKIFLNKRPLSSEKYLVKKVVYYKDGSINEWIYKENKK